MSDDPVDKAVDKSIGKAVDGVAKFFGAICMPAAEELGMLVRDQVRFYRVNNLLRIKEKTEKLLKGEAKKEVSVSPKFLKAVIEDASWAEDDAIQNLWAGLVAGEIKHGSQSDEAVIYTELLKSMSAYEARILKLVYGDDRIADLIYNRSHSDREFESVNPINIPIVDILSVSPTPLDYIVQNRSHEDIINDEVHHSLAFGFVKPQLHSLVRKGLIESWGISPDVHLENNVLFIPSSLGLDLYMRCTGYKVYPLEAYVLTRKHWRDKLGVESNQAPKRTV